MDASASEPGVGDWEAERQTLMDLLEHTQSLLKSAQDAAVRERQDASEQYRLLELRLTNQLKLVKEENASLREELDRINKTQGLDGMSLKGYMLREIEKIETRAAERESELLGLVESARNEVHIYKGHLESRAKVIADDHAQVTKDLEAAKQETKRIHAYYSTQIQDLKTEHSATMANLKRVAEDLKAAKLESQSIHEAENVKRAQLQQAWEKEREGLVGQVKKLQKALQEREKVVNELSSAVESDKRAEMTPLKAQNETLSFDKFALKQQLQLATALYVKKEKNMQLQLEKWKKLSEQLKEKTTPQPTQEADQGRLLGLLMNLEQNDKQMRETIHNLEFYTQKLNSALEAEESRQAEAQDGDALQRIREKEQRLDALLAQLADKREVPEIQRLQQDFAEVSQTYQSALRDVTAKAIAAFDQTTQELQDEIKSLKTENEDLLTLRLENQSLLQQLDQAKVTVRQELETQVSEELTHTQQELEHAKKMILTYMDSVQSLEESLQRSKEGSAEDPETQKLKAEVTRLTEENANLMDTKRKAEEASTAITTKLREQLEKKEKESTNLKAKLSQEKTRANDRIQANNTKLEESLAAISETNATLKAEIANFTSALPETTQIVKLWTDADAEATKTLQAQISEREALVLEVREQWKADVAGAKNAQGQQDLAGWKPLLKDAESQVKALNGLSSSLSQMLQTLAQLAEALTSTLEKREPRDTPSLHLEAELETLRQQLADKEAEHEQEMELVRTQAEAEVKSVKNIEFALTAEINSLRNKIKELKSLNSNR